MTEEESTEMMKSTRRAMEELSERVDKLTGLVEKGKGEVEEYTKANPIAALGIAFLVGIVTGTIVAASVSHKR